MQNSTNTPEIVTRFKSAVEAAVKFESDSASARQEAVARVNGINRKIESASSVQVAALAKELAEAEQELRVQELIGKRADAEAEELWKRAESLRPGAILKTMEALDEVIDGKAALGCEIIRSITNPAAFNADGELTHHGQAHAINSAGHGTRLATLAFQSKRALKDGTENYSYPRRTRISAALGKIDDALAIIPEIEAERKRLERVLAAVQQTMAAA